MILGCVLGSQKVLQPKKSEIPAETIRADSLGEIEIAESELKGMTSGRHRPLFDYGVLLARAGFGRDEIELKLGEIAGPKRKMRRKIRGILKSLSNYGWFED